MKPNIYRRFLSKLVPDTHLYIVRHGETEGNVMPAKYRDISDHAIMLTDKGRDQARRAGVFLADLLYSKYEASPLLFSHARIWHSPYYRTRLTAADIIYEIGQKFGAKRKGRISYLEDRLLYEQKAGLFDGLSAEEYSKLYPEYAEHYNKQKRHFGRIYASTPIGESRIDVAERARQVIGTIARDSKNSRLLQGQRPIRHVVVVCHGVTGPALVMEKMKYLPEWMDAERTPKQCWIRYIVGNSIIGPRDMGYIYGDDAPLGDPLATQLDVKSEREIIVLKPQRSTSIVPKNVRIIDPFQERYTP
jgi:broad specificity phosphatase PhoE